MAKNEKNKPPQKEIKKSDIADAAFKKKVTIINGCILLVFIIGLVSFLVYSWAKTESYPERFKAEVDAAKQAALVTDSDKSVIDIEVTDETFIDWSLEIFYSYHQHEGEHNEEDYACFEGNTIHIQGVFEIVPSGNTNVYQIYRKYIDVDGGENKVPTEVVFKDDFPAEKMPKNGDWVDVVGIVSSNNGLSCIKDAKVTVLDIGDKKEFAD
ncbi:MAG: hypothetical protein IIW72_07090 [Clostridia bacterium]|nr:hypothetical protein [Clostridia bacterium]